MNRKLHIQWIVCLLLCASSWMTSAHPLDPALLTVAATSETRFQVVWRTPGLQPRNAPIYPVFPEGCDETSDHELIEVAGWVTQRWLMECTEIPLAGKTIGIQGLRARKTDVIVRVTLPDDRKLTGLLNPRQTSWVIPEKASRLTVFGQYLRLGLEHILTGTDHQLFIFSLLLLIRNLKSLLWTLTAFTLGHSLTLSTCGPETDSCAAGASRGPHRTQHPPGCAGEFKRAQPGQTVRHDEAASIHGPVFRLPAWAGLCRRTG